MTRPQAAYVLPKYDAGDHEHYAHVPHLLAELAQHLRLTVVVERGSAPPGLEAAERVIVLQSADRSRLRRVGELLGVLVSLRRSGVRTVLLRYSRTMATAILLTRPFLRLRLLYWASGQSDHGRATTPLARLKHAALDGHFAWIVRRADRLLTGPEFMTQYMSRRWGVPMSQVALLYNDIDVDRFSPAPADERAQWRGAHGVGPDELVLLFVHRLSRRRGTDLLVPVVQRCAAAGLRPRLLVVGDGPDRGELEQEVALAGLGGTVQVLGALPNADLPSLYQVVDCLLMPSYEEGFPRVVLEAMACGTPVVACDAGGTRDLLPPDYSYVTPVGDAAALAASLVDLAGRGDREQLGQQLRGRVVERYSTQRVAPMYARLVADV